MKVRVDLATCQGYANCVVEADAIFDIDDETGKAIVLQETVPEDLAEAVRAAVASCPVDAISIEE
ncbi:MAG TPA: ferredoxin [Solirubrobacterales bacterium]|jgi:ferredoxin